MAHRFISEINKSAPKPSASDRTWSRWRTNHNLENETDAQRVKRIEDYKTKVRERIAWLGKLKEKYAKPKTDPEPKGGR